MTKNIFSFIYNSKIYILLLLISALGFSGCARISEPDPHDLTVDFEQNSGLGIGPGASYDEWAEAYGDYYVQRVTGEGILTPYAFEEKTDKEGAQVDRDGTYMISAFYIDGSPSGVNEIMSLYEVDAGGVTDLLTDPGFLKDHTVIYRYVTFTITNDIVSQVTGDYLDYNAEL